ncbi:MAG: molybdopterin-guanine dinucleotide biosynthesis protein B [Candidatus Cloacimonetes bacterium]|nr:molybdopterin-guanine dinucleotide biosynthesis protein B [Candidatus Cloacimonadota bacterium]
MKAFSVAGFSKSGKTTTVAALIDILKTRGYSVAAIKDIHFEDFTMEREGSDSWIFQQAGAKAVFARGLKETYLIQPLRTPLPDMLEMLDADWTIVEGMKRDPLPKIICAESEEQLSELVDDNVFAISGKISDNLHEYRGLPVINSKDNPRALADLVEQKVFEVLPLAKDECCQKCGLTCYQMVGEILCGRRKREDCQTDHNQMIHLRIGEKTIEMVPFVQNIFRDLILAFVKNLRGYKKGKIEVTLE